MAAQRTEKEDTEFKVVPETVSGTTLNQVVGTTLNQVVPSPPRRFTSRSALSSILTPLVKASPERDVPAEAPVTEKREVRRCSGCRKKVGLTGFRCRCGDLFCSEHRYSDRHVCSYDYKAAGREAIAKENPLVKAAKIIRL